MEANPRGNWLKPISWLFRPRTVLPFLILIGLILRLPNLGESLWFDEVIYSTSHRIGTLSQLLHFTLTQIPAPLYVILIFFWRRVFGEHEIIIRLPSLLFGLASIWLTYKLAKRFVHGSMPLLAGLLLCFSPVHIWYSQEATPYAMSMCLLLATVLTWFRLSTPPFRRGRYASYFVLLLAAVFTHYYVAVFLLPLTLLSFTTERSLRVKMIIAHGVVVLCLAFTLGAKYVSGHLWSGAAFLRPFTEFECWMLFFNWFAHGNSIWTFSPYGTTPGDLLTEPLLLIFQILLSAIFLLGLWKGHEMEKWTQTWELSIYIFSLPLTMFLLALVGYRKTYIERYLVVLLPFFVIVLARGVNQFTGIWLRRVFACMLIAISIASYGMFLNKSAIWTVYKPNPDWRSAAHYLLRQDKLSESLLLTFVAPDDLVYYLRKQSQEQQPSVITYDAETERVLSEGRPRNVYLINNSFWSGDFKHVLARFQQDQRLQWISLQAFKGAVIHNFALRRKMAETTVNPIKLQRVGPITTRAGKGFNIQPDGTSAIWAIGENILPTTTIIFNGKALRTVYGGSRHLTATVPEDLYSWPGVYKIYLKDFQAESNQIPFYVTQ